MHKSFSTDDLQAPPELSLDTYIPDIKPSVKWLQSEELSVYLYGNEHTEVIAKPSLCGLATLYFGSQPIYNVFDARVLRCFVGLFVCYFPGCSPVIMLCDNGTQV